MKKKVQFSDLGLSPQTLQAITKKGFTEPSEIQALTIPMLLEGEKDLIAQAQTGTGKTAAFGLPLIDLIDPKSKSVQALVLAPTRELAIQVSEEILSLCGDKKLKVVPIYGGQSIEEQFRKLKQGVHIVVGTPGRIIDHLNRKKLKLDEIEYLILDEADEMLNMGFVEDMEEIFEYANPEKRTLLFSATMPARIQKLAKKYMKGHELIKVEKKTLTNNLTEQFYFEVKSRDKFELLCRLIDVEEEFYGLVFCRTKRDVESVVTHLIDRGYLAEAIHGDISQASRERALGKFKKKKVNILVATDVAARGIDVDFLSHVINYALPHDTEAYVHRIGRTGRAGRKGVAITFISASQRRELMAIQAATKMNITKGKIPEVDDIISARQRKVSEEIASINAENLDEKYLDWAKELLSLGKPSSVLARVLKHAYSGQIKSESYKDIVEVTEDQSRRSEGRRRGGKDGRHQGGRGDRGGRDGRGNRRDSGGRRGGKDQVRLFVALGKKDRINPRKLVEIVSARSSIQSKQIDDIQIKDKFSFMTVPQDKADQIIENFKEKGKKPLVTRAKS